jgi:hypothetical protein
MTKLTLGLLIFAGAQVWVQVRSELQRQKERQAETDETLDRAFQLVWAEHFRLDALADHFKRADLIELAILGVLRPGDVLPRDWVKVSEALGMLSREAGFLGGVAVTSGYDIERQIGIFVGSVKAFAAEAPVTTDAERVQWVRKHEGESLKKWETSIHKLVVQLSLLFWDAASHYPRIAVERKLNFSDNLASDFAKAAVAALTKRSEPLSAPHKPS